jgi:ketosteroid isomerase-like protein
MLIDDNKAVARRAFEALTSGDTQALDYILAPDCTLHQGGFLQPIRGIDAIKSLPRQGILSERKVRIEKMVGEGNTVAIHWTNSGRYIDSDSSPSADKEVVFTSMSFATIEGGRVREIWNIQDMSTLWAQIGPSHDPVRDITTGSPE